MAEVVAIVRIENLSLYKDMAEFIITLAQGEDTHVPDYVQQRAYELACQIQTLLTKLEQTAKGAE